MQIYRRLFAKRLKKAREAKGINQSKLATSLEVEPPTVSRWENAHDFPGDERLPKMLEVLDVSEEFFTGETGLARPSDADLKRLINERASAVPLVLAMPVLERFLNEDPSVRAATLAVLYGDKTISRLYTSAGKEGSR